MLHACLTRLSLPANFTNQVQAIIVLLELQHSLGSLNLAVIDATKQEVTLTQPNNTIFTLARSRVKGECKSSPSAKNSIYSAEWGQSTQDEDSLVCDNLRSGGVLWGMVSSNIGWLLGCYSQLSCMNVSQHHKMECVNDVNATFFIISLDIF